MRILHISTRLILGGSQENTVLSCEEQSRRGHEVHLAFGPIYGPEGSLLARVESFNHAANAPGARGSSPQQARSASAGSGEGRATPITTHVVPHMVREVNPANDWRGERELRDLIATLKPDIVHTHSSKAGIIGRAAAWSVARERGERAPLGVVHTIHGPPFMPLDGGVLNRLKRRVVNGLYARAERYAARRCHAIVSVADAMTQQFLARGIGRPEQYATVWSGMEVERYLHAEPGEDRASMRAWLGIADDDFVVGTVARLAEHKGHDDLLDALGADLRANPRLKLLWVGDGWWRERLLARARGMGLQVREIDREGQAEHLTAHNSQLTAHGGAASEQRAAREAGGAQVLVTGLVPSERVPAMMRAMDVLAHPSSREGLPRTVPQALLCGVCPVAYDVDGTREVCADGKTGRLVPLADVGALREAIRWCVAHPAERAAMVERGRAMCAERFSVEAMADALERVYAAALDRAKQAT